MRILNPNYVAPIDPAAATVKTKLAAWFAANPSKKGVSVDQIKAAIVEAGPLTAGAIEQIARDAGWAVKADE